LLRKGGIWVLRDEHLRYAQNDKASFGCHYPAMIFVGPVLVMLRTYKAASSGGAVVLCRLQFYSLVEDRNTCAVDKYT
jgi:hypothetical protein